MGLQENIQTETVGDLPLREVIIVSPTTTLRQAVMRMCGKRLGCVVVVDDSGPLGTFTEEELVKVVSGNLDESVADHLSPRWGSVRISDPISNVVEIMQSKRLRFVLVTDAAGTAVVALTGQKGLTEYIADHFPQQVMVQRVGVKPYSDQREGA